MQRKMELLKARRDSQGDEFTQACIEGVAKSFKPGISVTLGFSPLALPVGIITGLRVEEDRLMALVDLDADGVKAVDDGMELASGGRFDLDKVDGHRLIDSFQLTGAALTKEKVK